MNKYVIYTAIVGNYDKILQPKVVDPDFDYTLFSNDINEKNIGIWQIRKINYYNKDQTKIARWVKTHPDELLSGYLFSVWMDGNIQIETDFIYQRTKELFNNNAIIASVIHPERECIYQEMLEIFILHYESLKTILNWTKILQNNGYPRNNGLNETNILFRNHTICTTGKIDCLWWTFIEKYSRRDQLSFNYVLWKLNIHCISLLPSKECARNSKNFNYLIHSNQSAKFYNHKAFFSWLKHYCLLYPNEESVIYENASKILKKQHPLLWLKIFEQKLRFIIYWRRLQNTIKKISIKTI